MEPEMQFGQRVRGFRLKSGLIQQQLAQRLSASSSYLSKVENERLHFGDYPSEKFIHTLADALEADEDELLLLTDRVPKAIRKRVREKPVDFQRQASLDNQSPGRLMGTLDEQASKGRTKR